MATTVDSDKQLIVVVSGGGPVGLTFTLHLTAMMGKHVKVIIYEGRWFVDEQGKIRWQDEKQGKTRRDQVVTLQDHVIDQMPYFIQRGLFKNFDERVWPTSRNIPIKEVEDRLFDLIQPFVQNGQVELVPENLNEQSECLVKGTFDILVGTDGSNSFVRRYCNIQMISEGLEYACGVAYNIPNNIPATEEPLHQSLNCVLTVSQTRYLVNSSTSRRGYLNIRLIQDEYEELRSRLEAFQSRNEPMDLLDYNKCPQSPVWTIIRQGLDFFRISPRYVFRVLPIEINVRHASIVVRELRFEIDNDVKSTKAHDEKKYKTALAFLAGDAAMCVHFWPGRGMNSGMKAAMALARNILRACTSKESINIRRPLRFLDFLDYEGFMARLRAREQQGRSLRVLINPIDKSLEAAYSYGHLSHCYKKYTKNLRYKLEETRQRFEGRSDWPHKSTPISDETLEYAINRVGPQAVAQLSLANPWPTREMSGVEVLVEETFPFDLRKFLPVPAVGFMNLTYAPSIMVTYSYHILWITGEKTNEAVDNLIQDIQNLQNHSKISTDTVRADSLAVVKTIEEAEQWLTANQALINQRNVQFKVVTAWEIDEDKTAINVIRTVRSKVSRVPVLIFSSKHDETRAALEFPNVITADNASEVKEFAGIKQEALWNAGWRVSHVHNANFIGHPDVESDKQSTDKHRKKSLIAAQLPYPLVNSDQSSLPALPNISFFYLSSLPPPISSSDAFSREIQKPSTLKPMLLWVDSHKNDVELENEIERNHSHVELNFKPTYKELDEYITRNLKELKVRKAVIIITRGFYSEENKCYTDIAQLLDSLHLGTIPMAVYTRSVNKLLQRTQNHPARVEVFDKASGLLGFITRNLPTVD